MAKKQKNDNYEHYHLFLLLTGILIGGFLVLFYLAPYISFSGAESYEQNYTFQTPVYASAKVNLVAIDQDGNGVSTPLIVEANPGTGKTLANVDKLLFWVDTQQSIQTAKSVAESVTKIDIDNYDLTYTIEAMNTTLIGGPSAGAAMTIATIAVLKNETLRSDVVMTGTINEDGTIGQIGGVLEKAQAAKQVGAKLFLVPVGQSTETVMKPIENCTNSDNFVYCETTYKQITTDIGQSAGIEVKEVENVIDAYEYFRSR